MNKVQRLLMASTVVSGVMWFKNAAAEAPVGNSALEIPNSSAIVLAQVTEPEQKSRSTPQKKPAADSMESPPGTPMPKGKSGRPVAPPAAAQDHAPAAPGHPVAPPAAAQDHAPVTPGSPVAP